MVFFQRSSRISRARFVLLLFDVFSLLLIHGAAIWFRFGAGEWGNYVGGHIISLLFSVSIYIAVYYAAGMYETQPKQQVYVLPIVSGLIAAMFIGLMFYAGAHGKIGRGVWLIASGLILLWSMTLRRGFQQVLNASFLRRAALIIFDRPELIRQMLPILQRQAMFRPVGLVFAGSGAEVPEQVEGIPVVCHIQELSACIEEHAASVVLVAVTARRTHELLSFLRTVRYKGIEIVDTVYLHEILYSEIPLAYINEEWLMTAALNSSQIQVQNIKRVFDVLIAFAGLVVGLPVMLVCAILIRATSPGPILYRQERVGLNGTVFTLHKLRSMALDAETSGAIWAASSDPRVTKVGYFLRKWRLDELPQLFNILKGEMSLVGPRPERPEFSEMLNGLIPFYNERLLVRPGLTGWAQVCFPYAATPAAAAKKLQFDLFYMKNMGFWLDTIIMLKTFKTILIGLQHESDKTMTQEEVIAQTDLS